MEIEHIQEIPYEEATTDERVTQLSDTAFKVWYAAALIRDDIHQLTGQDVHSVNSLVSPSTYELIEPTGIDPADVDSWAKQLIRVEKDNTLSPEQSQNCVQQYMTLLRSIGPHEALQLRDTISDHLHNHPKLVPYFQRIADFSPLLFTGTTIMHRMAEVQAQHMADGNPVERPLGWYTNAINSAAETHTRSSEFFSVLRARNARTVNDAMLNEFLSDWETEVDLVNAEVMNVGTAMAIHSLSADCAILMSATPYHFLYDSDLKKEFLSLQGPTEYPDGRESLFQTHSKNLFNRARKNKKSNFLVPTYLSVVDIEQYFGKMSEFWQQFNHTFNAENQIQSSTDDTRHSSMYRVGESGKMLIRSRYERDVNNRYSQARIALFGSKKLHGFNIRVDKEKKFKSVSMDIGGIQPQHGIAYARELAEHDAEGEIAMNYADVLNPDGTIRIDHPYYPSIMESSAEFVDKYDGRLRPLSIGNRIGIIAALAMQEGQILNLRRSEGSYGHHSRGLLSKNEDYYDRFEELAESLKISLEN